MAYYKRVLQDGEAVKHIATLNRLIYAPGVIIFFAGLVILMIFAEEKTGVGQSSFFGLIGVFVTVVGSLSLIRAIIRRLSTEMVVTDRRVILKEGFLSRKTIEINMDKVERVDVDQTILGRLFDYGSVTVKGTGASYEPFKMVNSPIIFRNAIMAR